MKTKEKRFLGIFKKKTTPAPVAPPPPQDESNSTAAAVSTTAEEETRTSFVSTLPEDVMPPRKGCIAQTSVIHYSPPGTVRASFLPSATSSVVSGGSDDSGTVVITRKSNIVLEDEESVISTPVSQYDESPIVQKPRTKRAAPPPPPPPAQPSPIASIPPMSPSLAPKHLRQTSTTSTISSPPPPPPHRKQENEIDYEEMLKKLQNKFDEWNMVRLEDGGSIKEERIKAEMFKDHEKLKQLLEKQINSDRPKPSSSNNNNSKMSNNNNNVKKQQSPVKIPQYGNFYVPPPTSPSPPARVGAVPGGTVYQKVEKAPPTSSTPSSSLPNGKPMSPRTDENRNEVKKKTSATAVQNTEAVDRLRREVEEQRQREREVKDYRNPKALAVQVKSPEPKRKEIVPPPPSSPTKSGPRMVEYKPMKSPGLPIDPEDIYEEIEEKAPPIPNTPPPKLSEYRKEQQSTAPRMPTVPSNGYVRLQVNGAAKKPAPSAPVVSPNLLKISQKPFNPPEFASSPKLLRKNPEPVAVSPKVYASIPVKEEKKYEKSQVHPQITNGGMITATSSPSSPYRKNQMNPPMTRGASVDQNGFEPRGPITNGTPMPKPTPPAASSPVNYRKMVKAVNAAPMTRTVSEDQTNYGYAPKTTINIATSPYNQRRTPSPSKMSPMARAMSTDQTPVGSPSTFRKTSAPATTFQPAATLRSVSTESPVPSPSTNRRSMITAGILTATSSKSAAVTSATSPPYPKGSNGPTVISIKSAVPNAPKPPKPTTLKGETFDISDVLKGPKLRKVGMPVERSGISLGKVVDAEPSSSRPSSTPPPPPPPPPPGVLASPALQPLASKNPDLRDSLMSEIREAGRLRAARAAQSA